MVIEWLKIKVAPEMREQYIQKDAEVWTAFLAEYPGFLGKEVWINPEDATEVILVIRWASKEDWKSVPSDRLAATDQRFAQALAGSYPIIEAGEYQVRKFAQS